MSEKEKKVRKRRRASITKRDFIIRVRPTLNRKHKWTGSVDVAIAPDPENKMSDEDYYQILHLCKMMCAIIPLTEGDEDLREDINDFIEKVVDKDYHNMIKEKNKPKANIVGVKDNVIHITIDSDTEGNA
jgi:hypothetical protein